MFAEGTWVTRGPVLHAMTAEYTHGEPRERRYVFSRMEGNLLGLVPYEDRQETLVVDIKDDKVQWVETTKVNIPRGAIRVGDGETKFIGKKHHQNTTITGGYVTEDGQFRRAFACECNLDIGEGDDLTGGIYEDEVLQVVVRLYLQSQRDVRTWHKNYKERDKNIGQNWSSKNRKW